MTPPLVDVSVVIPAYQAAETLERALASIAVQTVSPREVIVVDDGSDDDTVGCALACSELIANAELIVQEQPNQGAGAARNAGVRIATQPVIAFLDADDDWLPEHLESSLSLMFENNLTLTAHNEWLVEDGFESLNDSTARLTQWPDPFVSIFCKGCISTSTVLVRREAIATAGGFDPSLANGQDVDLWLAILSNPDVAFEIFEQPLSRYFIRPGSINSNVARRYLFFNRIALRWASAVVHRPGAGLRALWFRVAAIHFEAAKGLWAERDLPHLLGVFLMYPWHTARITIRGLFGKPCAPRNFLENTTSSEPVVSALRATPPR